MATSARLVLAHSQLLPRHGVGAGKRISGLPQLRSSRRSDLNSAAGKAIRDGGVRALVVAGPASDLVRVCVFYALLQAGVAGREGSSRWVRTGLAGLFAAAGGKGDGEKKDLSRVKSQWHASTKGTLVRRYRVPTKTEGRRLLDSISSLLSEDDTFRDVSTHKGCQIRRENAHAQTMCCNNVRALFDELPTPHLLVEILVFPPGPVTDAHYRKAKKLEQVLRAGKSI